MPQKMPKSIDISILLWYNQNIKKGEKRAMTREQLLEENTKLKIELANAKLELNN